MKRISIAALALLLLLPLMTCNKDSGTSSEYGFNIYPGTVFYGTESDAGKSHQISFGGTNYDCMPAASTCYAILYSSILNGTPYVGIEVEQENPTEVFTLKIWYPGSLPVIPGNSGNISVDTRSNIKVIVRNKSTSVTTVSTWTRNPFQINYTGVSGGIYTITTTGSPTFNIGGPLNITEIKASRVL